VRALLDCVKRTKKKLPDCSAEATDNTEFSADEVERFTPGGNKRVYFSHVTVAACVALRCGSPRRVSSRSGSAWPLSERWPAVCRERDIAGSRPSARARGSLVAAPF
jgi:hypothetical protein